MKKKNKLYSVIIISDATSTNKEFSISSKLIKKVFISVFVLLFIFGFIIFDYLSISFDKEKMIKLKTENERKNKTITELTLKMDELSISLKKMADYKERILIASGLKSPLALKEVGSGGGPIIDSSTLKSTTDNILINKQSNSNILDKAQKLARNAKKVENTLKYVNSVIDLQKVRLASTPSIWPTKGYLTDGFGWRTHPFTGKRNFHYGQDIATQLGNDILATADGFVLVVAHQNALGNLIVIDHGFGFTTRYAHLSGFNVKEGIRVKRGQVIGFVGNTGRSTAPHLHYEVRVFGKAQNPLNYIID